MQSMPKEITIVQLNRSNFLQQGQSASNKYCHCQVDLPILYIFYLNAIDSSPLLCWICRLIKEVFCRVIWLPRDAMITDQRENRTKLSLLFKVCLLSLHQRSKRSCSLWLNMSRFMSSGIQRDSAHVVKRNVDLKCWKC